jgi:hypothetical protein
MPDESRDLEIPAFYVAICRVARRECNPRLERAEFSQTL